MPNSNRIAAMNHRILQLSLVGLIVLGGCAPPPQAKRFGAGPNAVGGATDEHSVVASLTGGASNEAPASVTPGTRIVYYTTTASYEGQGSEWEEDPNGGYVDPKTGKHYNRKPHEGVTGGSASYNVNDVIALDDGRSAIATSVYAVLDNVAPRALTFGGGIGSAAFGAGLWAAPDVLQTVPESSGEDRIVRMPYDLNGKQVQGLWINSSAGGNHELHVYELSTGLLVHAASGGSMTPSQFRAPDETVTAGSTLASSTMASVRKITTPWANDEDGFNYQSLDYTGQEILALPDAPGNLSSSVSLKMTVKEKGKGWLMLQFDNHRDPGPTGHVSDSTTTFVTGANSLTPLYIAPGTLASLRQGQTIDHDELLKMDTTVGQTENLPRGPALTIRFASPTAENEWLYDLKTGLLVEIRQKNLTNYTTTTYSLQSAE